MTDTHRNEKRTRSQSDLSTVAGIIGWIVPAAEKLANDIAAAYEEVDGRNRPMNTPMGRLLHEGNSALGQFRSAFVVIQKRHDEEIARLTGERNQRDAAIAKIESVVRFHAISAHALGRGDEERQWLDVLGMIEHSVSSESSRDNNARALDPYPLLITNRSGAHVTTAPYSSLGHQMVHEVATFNPNPVFEQDEDRYRSQAPSPKRGNADDGTGLEDMTRGRA